MKTIMQKFMVLLSLLGIGCAQSQDNTTQPTPNPNTDLVSTTQITDASCGQAAVFQYIPGILYPPVLNPNNWSPDITNLELYWYNIAPKHQNKVLVWFGDSRMVLFEMRYKFPISVYGIARGSSSSVGVIDRLPNLQNILALKPGPNIGGIYIQVGINDIIGTHFGFNVTDMKANLQTIATYLNTNFPGVPVTFGDVITYKPTSDQNILFDMIDDMNAYLKQFCTTNGYGFIEMNPIFADTDRSLKDIYNADSIHFTQAGFDVMYNKIMANYMNWVN